MDTCLTLDYISHPDITQLCPLAGRTADEQELIHQAQNGSLDSFNELVLTYQDAVYRQAFWMLNEEEAAEDAVQEVFILVFRKLFMYHGGSFRSWLLKITTNYCLDQIRSMKRQRWIPLEQTFEDGGEKGSYWMKAQEELPEQALERSETREVINRCFQKLTPEYRTVLLLVDVQEMDYREAAAVLRLPIGTLKSRVARARQRLQMDLQKVLKN
jgi:RNA polymerase sigma-70 factor (ECF subfamily)